MPFRIALVEDDAEMAQAMRSVLLRERYDVQVFSDASEALSSLRTERVPDLIVLDLWTPNMNGWQFRLEQKKDPRLAGVPLIAMSGDRSAHAAAIDADRFLPKPITGSALLASARELLARASSAESATDSATVPAYVPLADWNALYMILTDLNDARAHIKLLLTELAGFPAARAIALNVLLERAEACAQRSLDAHARELPRDRGPLRTGQRAEALHFDTVGAFLSWCDGSTPEYSPAQSVDLLTVLASCLREGLHVLPRLRFSLTSEGVPAVAGSWEHVVQVVRNMLCNAREALDGAPSPSLDVRLVNHYRAVELLLTDEGCGARVRQLERVFDPFFTTKKGHTGLGLTVARRIATRLDGRVELERAPAGGTTVRLLLPAAIELGAAALTTQTLLPRLLIVHQAPRALALSRSLESTFCVQTASPEAAMRELLYGASYDLVLCALVMPEMTGISFMSAMTLSNPTQAERLVMLLPPEFGSHTAKLLEELHIWHVDEDLSAQEMASFLLRLLALWKSLRLR